MEIGKYAGFIGEVRRLYVEGYTKEKIAKVTGLHPKGVHYILYVLLKVKEKDPRANLVEELPKDLISRICTLASYGYNNKEISEDVNLPHRRVTLIVKEARKKKIIQNFC